MSVSVDNGVLRLQGDCQVEEAETLVGLLQSAGASSVDLSQCRHLHSALVQALLAFRVRIVGESQTPFIRDFVAPALDLAGRVAAEGHADLDTIERQPTSEARASPSKRS